jgi:AcrR family transcriptional regulator
VPPVANPRWRRLEPDERREQILECARRLFGERHYAAVSTTDIARAAGVARGLINHYFGTKRELYLEVVRQVVFIPPPAAVDLPDGPPEARVAAAVDWWLDAVWRHRSMWLVALGAQGFGRDAELEAIIEEAEDVGVERVLEALDLQGAGEPTRAAIRAYSGFAQFAAREWLVRRTLSREQLHALLSRTLLALVLRIVPALPPAPPPARAGRETRDTPGGRFLAASGGGADAFRD